MRRTRHGTPPAKKMHFFASTQVCRKDTSISLIKLLHKIIHIPAIIRESEDVRKVVLNYNKKDKFMMEKLFKAVEKINDLHVIGPQGKRMEFSLENHKS